MAPRSPTPNIWPELGTNDITPGCGQAALADINTFLFALAGGTGCAISGGMACQYQWGMNSCCPKGIGMGGSCSMATMSRSCLVVPSTAN